MNNAEQLRSAIHRRDLETAATYYQLPERVIEDETEKLERIKRRIAAVLDGQLALFSLSCEGGQIHQADDDGVPHMRLVEAWWQFFMETENGNCVNAPVSGIGANQSAGETSFAC